VKLLIVLSNVSVRELCQVVDHSQVLKALISYLLYQDLGADLDFAAVCMGLLEPVY
jgi:hypothetical protein